MKEHSVTQRPAHVVYIAGSGRSGSTLVERSLGAIPGWVNVGELIELFRKQTVSAELCGCGELFLECPFWSAVGDRAFGGWSQAALDQVGNLQRQLSRQRFVPRLLATKGTGSSHFDQTLREYGSVYARLYQAVAEVADADVVVDASKWPGQALALRRALPFDMSLLNVVRDPRGVAYSWAKAGVRRPHGGERDTVMATHSPRHTAVRWTAFQTEIAAIGHAFDSRGRLRYEDFVADPAAELRRAIAALGLPIADDDLAHVHGDSIDLPASHGIAGNPSRFTSGEVRLLSDNTWTRDFPERDRRIVTAITLPLLPRFDYPVKVTPAAAVAAGADAPIAEWPLVSVILATRGRPELVREALVSVVEQDYAGDLEIVVVHDQEDTQAGLKDLARPGRSISLVTNDEHAPGLTGARNTGLDHVTADFVATCDDDDFWDTEKLRMQMARMLREPETTVLGTGIRLLMGEDTVFDWPGDSSVISREQLLRHRRKELHSSTLLVRREVYDKVGGYDEKLPMSYGEDYEFLLRAIETGQIGVVNQPLASIRKYNASWFRERAEVVAEALQYLLDKYPELAESRRGSARLLGQIAFARSTMGERRVALQTAGRAFRRSPIAPHAGLAVVHATTGIDPRLLLGSVRKLGRGIT
jgi:GT2 family glycosyltransferase